MELGQLQAMLCAEGSHIVTLTGPGGVGKSRVARELSVRLAGRWRDGVAWGPLGCADQRQCDDGTGCGDQSGSPSAP